MKKTVLRYGAWAALAELMFFVLTWGVIYLTNADHKAQGYIGYANIICPLLFVYFGIRYYRDKINNGAITFLNALKVGLLIVILPAIAFGIIETIYVLYIDPKFYDTVWSYDIEQYRKTLSPAQFAIKLKEMKQELEYLKNPLINFVDMILTIGATGIIMTIISALLLMRKSTKAV